MNRSPHESGNVNADTNQMTSQISSTVTEVFSEQDMNLLGKRKSLSIKLTGLFSLKCGKGS